MSVDDIPRTLEWCPTADGWVPSALTATRFDEAAAHVHLIDQRVLPHHLEYLDCYTSTQMCDAIETLAVRGAPAIGVSGAMAVVLWALNEWPIVREARQTSKNDMDSPRVFANLLAERGRQIAETRPTAVNLSWGVEQISSLAKKLAGRDVQIPQIIKQLEARAVEMAEQDVECCRLIGVHGAEIFAKLSEALGRPLRVETHCNAGSLATVHRGTATAVIYEAYEQGLIEKVWVDETRPVDQGARLTAWELGKAGVPYTLVCDNMAASIMSQGLVDAVVVGADRICANGDTANKIGTYGLALIAKAFDVPFFVAAPLSTFDETLAEGSLIEIEERDEDEVRCMPHAGEWLQVAPHNCDVYNPAFDVTPNELIAQIITEEE